MSPTDAPPPEARLKVRDLHLRRGGRPVLLGVSFAVAPGEILGLLGPNGAGKSSALLAIVGLIPSDSGEIALDGRPGRPGDADLRERAGVVFQSPALDGRLSARENLRLAGGLYGLRGDDLRRRVTDALALAELSDRADEPVRRLSGGQRRRIELTRALLHDPSLLLLDEPTTGLDQASFRRVWGVLEDRARRTGMAAVLTTHRADEAGRCDRLAVIHEGRIVADDTPEALRRQVGGDVLELRVADAEAAAEVLSRDLGLDARVRGDTVRVVTERGHEIVPRVAETLPRGALRSLTVHEPGLADAYLALTGQGLDEIGSETGGAS